MRLTMREYGNCMNSLLNWGGEALTLNRMHGPWLGWGLLYCVMEQQSHALHAGMHNNNNNAYL